MKRRIAVLLAFGMLPWAGLDAQQNANTTFRVSAHVQPACEIIASDLNLGNDTAQSASPRPGTTLLRTTCTPDTIYNVGLGKGASSGTDIVTGGLGTDLTQDHTVFGAIPVTQVFPAEEHGDTVTVRIYY